MSLCCDRFGVQVCVRQWGESQHVYLLLTTAAGMSPSKKATTIRAVRAPAFIFHRWHAEM